jgi:hypothetical protein
MSSTAWIELYDKEHRPPPTSLQDFWDSETRAMFTDFCEIIGNKYGLHLIRGKYTEKYGWSFTFSISSFQFLRNIYILDDGFTVNKIIVKSRDDFQAAIDYISSLPVEAFRAKLEEKIKKRNESQKARSKRRLERERNAKEEFMKSIDPKKLNKFVWSPKISEEKIRKLYESDARMIYDDELVDEVGYTLYARCLQGRDERLLANERKLKCHGCGEINNAPQNDRIVCPCGHAYMFYEYMRSFNKNGMPSRSATPFFNEFIKKWEMVKTYADKMLAIDYVINECHMNMLAGNGQRGFAGGNLIDSKNVQELILSLAYK